MPWKECNVVEERPRFIARLLDGEKMAGLCREFGTIPADAMGAIRNAPPANYWINGALPGISSRVRRTI